jgi:hypothetical protein
MMVYKPHDSFFRWLFAIAAHLHSLLKLAENFNHEVAEFLKAVNLNTLVRIPDSYSEVDDTGEADLAFRVNVSTGAPLIVGVLLEHKSGRDSNVFEQIADYVHSVMRIYDKTRAYSGIPTMTIIIYNGPTNWNPLDKLEDGYPEFFRGRVLPFRCAFVNVADIPDSACFACDDIATGMGVIAMKYAFNEQKIKEILPKFADALRKLPHYEASCLLHKISVYLAEYLSEEAQKELDMAFVSVGQKYGFVSAGDVFRQRIADERKKAEDERAKSEAEKLSTARGLLEDGVAMDMLVRRFNLTEEQIRGK